MKPIRITFIVFFSFFFLLSFAQTDLNKATLFNQTALLKHIELLSSDAFEGRRTGTLGALKTRKYIVNQFQTLNILPLIKDYEQSFSFKEKGAKHQGINVLGFVKGAVFPEKYVVISAHYDHEGIIKGNIYNGADDNASGLSALFSFAEYFKNYPPKHSVVLVAFDAEELGLQGSKYFLDNPLIPLKSIVTNINMDMISRSDENKLFAVGTRFNSVLRRVILNTNTSKSLKLLTGHEGADSSENWLYASDHASFHRKDIPFIYFGVENHIDYHQPTDDFENIHPEFYVEAVETIISVFEQIDALKF